MPTYDIIVKQDGKYIGHWIITKDDKEAAKKRVLAIVTEYGHKGTVQLGIKEIHK